MMGREKERTVEEITYTIPAAGDPFIAAYPEFEDAPCLSCLDTGYVTIGYEEDGEEFYEEVPCRRCNKGKK
jgi:hypothetical protein